MAKSTLLLVLLITMLCNSMFVHGRFMDDYETVVKEFKRSGCKIGCWSAFENCLNIDGSISGHLICLERKDGCLTHC